MILLSKFIDKIYDGSSQLLTCHNQYFCDSKIIGNQCVTKYNTIP